MQQQDLICNKCFCWLVGHILTLRWLQVSFFFKKICDGGGFRTNLYLYISSQWRRGRNLGLHTLIFIIHKEKIRLNITTTRKNKDLSVPYSNPTTMIISIWQKPPTRSPCPKTWKMERGKKEWSQPIWIKYVFVFHLLTEISCCN